MIRMFSWILNLGKCSHRRVRCVHGMEMWYSMSQWRGVIRRSACIDCGKYLNWGLPYICTETDQPHEERL